MRFPEASRTRPVRRTAPPSRPFAGAPLPVVWRLTAVAALIASLAGAILTAPVVASGGTCAEGQVWDDAQQLCVDPTPAGSGDQNQDQGQDQPVVVDGDGTTSDDTALPTETAPEAPTPTPTATTTTTTTASASGGTLTVSAFTCPQGYALSAPTANPAVECAAPATGLQGTLRAGNQPPVQQPLTGATTFAVPAAGPLTVDLVSTAPVGATDAAWTCQGASGQPVAGMGSTIATRIADGEQVSCQVFIVAPAAGSLTTTATTTATTTPTVAPGVAASGSPAPSFSGPALNGPGLGSIMLVLSMCPIGFDPTSGVDPSNVCQKDYLFAAYPITFTAINTDSDTSTTGVNDTFLGWVTFDGLQPGPYRVQAALPAGISTIVFENCADGATAGNGQMTLSATVTAGANVTCYIDAVLDPNLPTPTRAPNTNPSSFSVVSARCPAGFVAGTTAIDPNRVCTGTGAGVRFNVSGPAGSANPVGVAGTDSLSVSATPGVYHVSFTLPADIASLAGVSCGGYDIQEQHSIDDRTMTATVSGTDVSIDVDVPGAFFFTCTFFVVPSGPSPTPTPSPTLTPTITPTPTMTVAGTGSTSSQGSFGTTSQPAQGQAPAQGGPAASQQGGPESASSSSGQDGGTGTTQTPASPAGSLSIAIESFLCPVGFQEPPAGLAPDGCFDAYPGAIYRLDGTTTGLALQATAGDILPDAAYFTELPPDDYRISQQAAPGIVTSFGYCSLVGGDAQGAPVTPPVTGGAVQQAFDAAARTFTCAWYSIPDATFGGVPAPAPPQGVSLTVHAFTCPAAYDPVAADADPTRDCLAPAQGIRFTATGQGTGVTTALTTGATPDTPANPLDGASRSGTITFTGLAPDTYTLTQDATGVGVDAPASAFVSSCSLATAGDADVPVYPTVADGAMQVQLNDNEALACLWYIVPPAQGGETDGGQALDGVAIVIDPVRSPVTERSRRRGGALRRGVRDRTGGNWVTLRILGHADGP